MKKYIKFLTAVVFSVLVCSCGKNCKEATLPYEFVIPVNVSPMADTLHVGDTLFISSVFSEYVYDRNNDRSFLIENIEFDPRCAFNRVDIEPPVGAISEQSLIYDKDKYEVFLTNHSDGTTSIVSEHIKVEDRYELDFLLILEQPGLYLFMIQRLPHYKGRDDDFPGRCNKWAPDFNYVLDNAEESNYDFLKDAEAEFVQVLLEPKWEKNFYDGAGYCFYVVE